MQGDGPRSMLGVVLIDGQQHDGAVARNLPCEAKIPCIGDGKVYIHQRSATY